MGCGTSKKPQFVATVRTFPASHSPSHHGGQAPANQQHPPYPLVQQQQQQQRPLRRVALERDTLMRYVQIEKEINSLEARNVVQHLQTKWDELKGLEQDIQRLSATYQSCQELTLKEKKDVDDMQEPSVREFFADQASFDAKLSKEQEEWLAAVNKQEVALKELQSAIALKENAKTMVKELHAEAQKLQALYKEQDRILSAIFDGQYGSDREYQLEREHDVCCDRQQRISAAKARWQAAKLLVYHASSQLGYAVERWQYVSRIPVDNGQMRYSIATEVRNYLIAASTNLRNSQNYLRGIDFPYCKQDEISTLDRATNNLFTDLNHESRHQHAMQVYSSLHKRSCALLQWFEAVIDKTIENDLLASTEELFAKKRELRMERVRLIKGKLTDLMGPQAAEEAGLDEDGNLTDARRLQEQLSVVNEQEMKKQLESVKVVQPEGAEQRQVQATAPMAEEAGEANEQQQQQQQQQSEAPPPPPPAADASKAAKAEVMPLKDLAPPPSQEKLFGDIDSIKKQYEIDMEEFQRAQEVNRARVEQGLQEKLAARKSRKSRKLAQQQETDKLLKESAGA